ncbi:DUF1993 family protein, partial [Devosia sp.]|uniref:DUF1993 family protein n=1 Tax=Devosia sp. TaxID=1871048 RepID=UPI003EEB310E
FEELRARIAKAIDLLASTRPEDLADSDTREVVLKLGGNDMPLSGLDYLTKFAMPNFYFHVTTAYAILRANGAPIGKCDYIAGADSRA